MARWLTRSIHFTMTTTMLTSFLILFTPAFGLECYYYRIRAEDTLTPESVMARNCSSSISSCVKIIARNEISQQEQSEAPSTIEGRCAFTTYECAKREEKCTTEPPTIRSGVTIHEYKCCSRASLSNGEPSSVTQTALHICILLLSFLYR
ncbi:hypothetical protein GCK32_008117 [Trichostrongylus colubriformis]|uniref:Uncharacterized protein n=1 Tax=Trichostrongylus colubriformis TaxID=6319 RepID=A0AAN8F3X5_TRICO